MDFFQPVPEPEVTVSSVEYGFDLELYTFSQAAIDLEVNFPRKEKS